MKVVEFFGKQIVVDEEALRATLDEVERERRARLPASAAEEMEKFDELMRAGDWKAVKELAKAGMHESQRRLQEIRALARALRKAPKKPRSNEPPRGSGSRRPRAA